VAWDVEGTAEFEEWYASLDASDQEALNDSIDRLIENGPALGRPYADTVRQSAFPNMKELRTQAKGDPLRTFFAFDPRRSAILLIGGDKTGDNRFYERMVPQADRLYATYLEELTSEGLI
jgi:hypothetical protein